MLDTIDMIYKNWKSKLEISLLIAKLMISNFAMEVQSWFKSFICKIKLQNHRGMLLFKIQEVECKVKKNHLGLNWMVIASIKLIRT